MAANLQDWHSFLSSRRRSEMVKNEVFGTTSKKEGQVDRGEVPVTPRGEGAHLVAQGLDAMGCSSYRRGVPSRKEEMDRAQRYAPPSLLSSCLESGVAKGQSMRDGPRPSMAPERVAKGKGPSTAVPIPVGGGCDGGPTASRATYAEGHLSGGPPGHSYVHGPGEVHMGRVPQTQTMSGRGSQWGRGPAGPPADRQGEG